MSHPVLHFYYKTKKFLQNQNTFIFSLLLNSILFFTVYVFLDPFFRTNDDVGMLLRVKGLSAVIEASPNIIFSNFILGKFLVYLYKNFPTIPWYGLHLISTLFLSHICILYVLIKKQPTFLIALIGYLLYFALLGVEILTGLQFTIVSSFACFSGLLIIIYTEENEENRYLYIFTGFFLICYAGLIRWNAVYLYTVLSFFFLIKLFTKKYLQFIFKDLRVIAICLSLLFCFSLYKLDKAFYSSKPEWSDHINLNPIRSDFLDSNIAHRVGIKERTKIFKTQGWSYNDYEMLRSWFFFDPDTYSIKKMHELQKKFPSANILNFKKNVKRFFKVAVYNTFSIKFFLLLFLSLPLIYYTKETRIQIFGLTALIILFFGYLIIFKKIPPPRIFMPLFSFYYLTLLLHPTKKCLKKRGYQTYTIAVFIITLLISPTCFTYPFTQVKNNKKNQIKFKKYITEVIKPKKEQLYIRWGSSFSWSQIPPLGDLSFLSNFQEFGLGSAQRTPDNKQILEAYNIKNLYTDIIDNDKIFLITYAKPRHRKLFTQYVLEHYGRSILFNNIISNNRYVISKIVEENKGHDDL